MAKIFISYKYRDKHVRQNSSCNWNDWSNDAENENYLTARDYVDHLMEKILTDHTNKAEKDNEDLSNFTEDVIQQKLYDRIYDSTVTIVLMSKKMMEPSNEKFQWIPREISYSLKEKTREDKTSYTNGILAVFLPDEDNKYDYGVIEKNCGVRSWQTNSFFKIIRENMFNKKEKSQTYCNLCKGYHYYKNDHSYIHPVKWDDFVNNHNLYIDRVLDFKDRLYEFELTKELE